jgi:hypothetical protein
MVMNDPDPVNLLLLTCSRTSSLTEVSSWTKMGTAPDSITTRV